MIATSTAQASPSVYLDDPTYEGLQRMYALERLGPYSGGLYPLTSRRIRQLLTFANERVPHQFAAPESGFWIAPLRRWRGTAAFMRISKRPYSLSTRPRDLAGALSLHCERNAGAPCGTGTGIISDLDTSVGYADWVSGAIRLRAFIGDDSYEPDLELDRLSLGFEYGPVAFVAGRDAFALGPSARTHLAWGRHSGPADHVRITTSHPFAITKSLRVNGQYILARLRSPQTYPGNLASIVRGQVDIADNLELAMFELVQLGGEGAPSLGFVDFILEHVRRRDATASSTDSSNRRFGFDLASRIGALSGARLYYSLVFEDIRRARFIDAIRYDADHLVGVELAAIGPGRRHGVTVEWHQTGVRSHEHKPRTTGFTNRGFTVGAPLGPDAESFYVGARLSWDSFSLYPWFELARLSSDTYEFVIDGPINRTSVGEDEGRYRVGTRARFVLRENLWLEGEAMFERVDDFAFESGVSRNSGGVTASIVWYPDGPLGRLNLN